jgi:hypothetical protein
MTVTVTTAADTTDRNGQARFVGFSLIRIEFVLPSRRERGRCLKKSGFILVDDQLSLHRQSAPL